MINSIPQADILRQVELGLAALRRALETETDPEEIADLEFQVELREGIALRLRAKLGQLT